ncbi:MAG: hypothetical protein ACFFDC_11095 [Promethearchaeota archaeon]
MLKQKDHNLHNCIKLRTVTLIVIFSISLVTVVSPVTGTSQYNIYPNSAYGTFDNYNNVKANDGAYAIGENANEYIKTYNYPFSESSFFLTRIKAEIEVRVTASAEPTRFKIGIYVPNDGWRWSSEYTCSSTGWTQYGKVENYNNLLVTNPYYIEIRLKITSNPLPFVDFYVDYIRMDTDYSAAYAQLEVQDYYVTSPSGSPVKGDDIFFKIKIKNTGNVPLTDIEVKIKIKGETYTWSEYICSYVDWDSYLAVGATETHTIAFDPIFSCLAGWFAWNAGSYYIDLVTARCAEGAFDTRGTDYEFNVNVESETHKVFIAYFVNNQWYSQGKSDPGEKITEASQYFWNVYGVNLHPLSSPMAWNPPDGYNCSQLIDRLEIDAGQFLGLTGDWKSAGGTHIDNHGFDVVAGFTGYWSDHVGMAIMNRNRLVVTGGSTIYGNKLYDSQVDNIFQHELSHCYGAEDRYDWDYYSVMSKPTGLFNVNNWAWVDYDIMYPHRDQFDGL